MEGVWNTVSLGLSEGFTARKPSLLSASEASEAKARGGVFGSIFGSGGGFLKLALCSGDGHTLSRAEDLCAHNLLIIPKALQRYVPVMCRFCETVPSPVIVRKEVPQVRPFQGLLPKRIAIAFSLSRDFGPDQLKEYPEAAPATLACAGASAQIRRSDLVRQTWAMAFGSCALCTDHCNFRSIWPGSVHSFPVGSVPNTCEIKTTQAQAGIYCLVPASCPTLEL